MKRSRCSPCLVGSPIKPVTAAKKRGRRGVVRAARPSPWQRRPRLSGSGGVALLQIRDRASVRNALNASRDDRRRSRDLRTVLRHRPVPVGHRHVAGRSPAAPARTRRDRRGATGGSAPSRAGSGSGGSAPVVVAAPVLGPLVEPVELAKGADGSARAGSASRQSMFIRCFTSPY